MTKSVIFILMGIIGIVTFQQALALPEVEDEVVIGFGDGERGRIPSWVDQSFIWYAQKQISQTELVNSIEFLVKENIIQIPSMVQTAEAQEVTQAMQELQQKVAQLDSFDEKQIDAILAIEDPEERKVKCSKLKDVNINIKLACKAGEFGMWLLEKILEAEEQQQQLGVLSEQIKKAEISQVDETSALPAGTAGTYVKYKKGTPDNYRLTVQCDPGDVATGGGFAPALQIGNEQNYLASMPYPTNYANNPRMNNPTGWTYMSMDPGEARVWVVCLDLTPSVPSTGTTP